MLIHQNYNSISTNDYDIRFWRNQDHPSHFHQHYELIYVLSGTITCIIHNHKEVVHEGSFCLILPNEIHSILSDGDSYIWIAVFSGEYVPAFVVKTKDYYAKTAAFQCSESIHNFLLNNLVCEEQPERILLKSCLYSACSEYLNQTQLLSSASKDFKLLHQITSYVENHYQSPITLQDISKSFGYNYSYLSHYFNQTFEMSFKKFLNNYRLELARQLLLETSYSIAEISLETGFQSVRSFNNFFKNELGISPSEFRKISRP